MERTRRSPRILVSGLVAAVLAAVPLPCASQTTVASVEITAPDGAPGDAFGRSVAVSGDTLIVGAYGNDARGEDAGAAYVFVRDTAGRWNPQQKWLPAELLPGDHFGWSVAVDGDLAVVGAPGDWRAGGGAGLDALNRGAAYVFQRAGGVWQQVTRIQPEYLVSGDQFGFAVAVSGERLMVSAPYRVAGSSGLPGQDAGRYAGLVAIFRRTAAGWVTEAEWSWGGGDFSAHDWFGFSVALDGDDAVIGSPAPTSWTSPTLRHRGDDWHGWPYRLEQTDGTGDGAWLSSVTATARDLDGSLVVLDMGTVRRVAATGEVTTLFGGGAGTQVLGDGMTVDTQGRIPDHLQLVHHRQILPGPGRPRAAVHSGRHGDACRGGDPHRRHQQSRAQRRWWNPRARGLHGRGYLRRRRRDDRRRQEG